MKKKFRLLVSTALLSLNLIISVTYASAQGSPFSGGGTGLKDDPYLIAQFTDLILLRDYCGDSYSNTHFRLISDITVSGIWTPVGNESCKFTGHFHGGGHTVSGLDMRDKKDYAGLFGYSTGRIDSLFVEGTEMKGERYSGGLVGYNSGTIIFCHARINRVEASKTGGQAYSGGLVGYNTGVIRNSSAKGNVQTYGLVSAYSGGLVGCSSSDESEITDCFAIVDVEALGFDNHTAYSGGLVGYLDGTHVFRCYASGTTKAETDSGGTKHIGAVIGYKVNGNVTNCYFNSDIVGSSVQGIGSGAGTVEGKSTVEMKLRDTYIDWNFNDVWGINGDYPYLRPLPFKLSNITVSHGVLTPVFDPNTQNYNAECEKDVEHIIISVETSAFADADISGGGSHDLVEGKNIFTITVAHHGGEYKYTIHIHRKYTMFLDAKGGTVSPERLEIISGNNALPDPVRMGYEFTEWNAQPDGLGRSYTDEDVQDASGISSLYAIWKAKEYTLTFDAVEGNVDPSFIPVTYGMAVGKLPVPDKEGYTFEKWNTALVGTGSAYDETTVYEAIESTTVYARWTPNEYTVKFKLNIDGETDHPDDRTVHYGDQVILLPEVSPRYGYDFIGWNDAKDGSGTNYPDPFVYNIPSDITLYAQWKGHSYKLMFDANYQGGLSYPDKPVVYGSAVGELPEPSRTGYTFVWKDSKDESGDVYDHNTVFETDRDIYLYAVWSPKNYTLTYDANGGTVDPDATHISYGATVYPPTPARSNYIFREWNTEVDGKGNTFSDETPYYYDKNTTVYAQWTGEPYKITFDAQQGIVTPNQEIGVRYGSPVVLPDPVRPGYKFEGWFTGVAGNGNKYSTGDTYMVAGNTTLYATWTLQTYTVTFNCNYLDDNTYPNGFLDKEIKVTYLTEIGQLLPTPVRSNYDFVEWQDIDGNIYKENTVYEKTGDLILYAQWKGIKCTISFEIIGRCSDNNPLPSKVVFYDDPVGELPTDICSGYTPVWKDENNIVYDPTTRVTGTIKLQASEWIANNYRLTLIPSGGSVISRSVTVTYDAPVGTLPIPGRYGYEFEGWYTDPEYNNKYETTTKYLSSRNSFAYAKWKGKGPFTLSFDVQGGSNTSIAGMSVYYGDPVGPLPDPGTREHYYFDGWNTQSDGAGITYTEDTPYKIDVDDATLYARWIGKEYTLNFKTEGSVDPTSKSVNYGSRVGTLPVPVRPGYAFEGWSTIPNGGKEIPYYTEQQVYGETKHTDLYAQWSKRVYTITLHYNYSDTPERILGGIEYGAVVPLESLNDREYYEFKGWNTSMDGLGHPYKSSIKYEFEDSNLDLYAIWRGNPYTLHFDVNYPGGENNIRTQPVYYGSPVGWLPPSDIRTGYTATWNVDKKGTGQTYTKDTEYMELTDMTLYAQWTANTHYLLFEAIDGVVPEPYKEVTFGAYVKQLPVPIRNGYTFKEWNTMLDGNGIAYDESTEYKVDGNTSLYAQWEANEYDLILDFNDGTGKHDEIKVKYDSPIQQLPNNLTRQGYTFNYIKGWTTNKDGSGEVFQNGDVYRKMEPTLLYAQWTANSYTVTFNNNGGGSITPANPRTVIYDEPLSTLPAATRTGYDFAGWSTDPDGETLYTQYTPYTIADNATFYAQWTKKEYMLFFVYDNVTIASIPVQYDSPIQFPDKPIRTGYTFDRWNTEKDGSGGEDYREGTVYRKESDNTVYAQWKVRFCTVTFDSEGTPSPKYVEYNSSITLPDATRNGCIFAGWKINGTTYAEGDKYTVSDDVTLTAQWTFLPYTITFEFNENEGGSCGELSREVKYNTSIGKLPGATRAGYDFKGWFTGQGGNDEEYVDNKTYSVAGDITLYAKWAVGAYTISFDARGGEKVENKQVYFNTKVGTLLDPIRVGYKFEGWFVDVNNDDTKYTSETVYKTVGNITLYAKWTVKKYTLSFDTRGGVTVPAISVNYDTEASLPDPTRTGYAFKEWNTLSDGTGFAYSKSFNYNEDREITLYAQWKAETYKLKFDAQGGNSINDKEVEYDKAVGELPGLERPGYTFAGWFTGTGGDGNQYKSETVYKTAGATTLYAKWTARDYQLVFKSNYAGGIDPSSQNVTYDQPIVSLPTATTVTRLGYNLKEWNTAEDGNGGTKYTVGTPYTVAGNTTLYAQWTPAVYTISFDVNYLDNTVAPEIQPKQVAYNAEVKLDDPVRTGYTFKGWFTNVNDDGTKYKSGTIYTTAGDITLYARWELKSYKVSFYGVNVNLAPQERKHGETVEYPGDHLIREGYVFGGWYKDNDPWDFNTPLTGDVRLDAKWNSSDPTLKNITVNHGTLEPNFKPEILEYDIIVSYDVGTITVMGVPNHAGATITGNVEDMVLSPGPDRINIVTLKVKAEDGVKEKSYVIRIKRADHILSNEANLVYITADKRQLTVTGNVIEYAADCNQQSFALELSGSPYSTVWVAGQLYEPGQIIETDGDKTKVDIRVVSETGNATKDYTLIVYKAITADLYYMRWENVLSINANPNIGYNIEAVRWFKSDGSHVGNKGYIQIEQLKDPMSHYYAEIKTQEKEGWRHVCGIPKTRSIEKITAYPNPVLYGEDVTLKLPEHYIGATLNIYDIKGSLVKSGISLPEKSNSINVSELNLSSGMYLFNIVKDNNREAVKIIIE